MLLASVSESGAGRELGQFVAVQQDKPRPPASCRARLVPLSDHMPRALAEGGGPSLAGSDVLLRGTGREREKGDNHRRRT